MKEKRVACWLFCQTANAAFQSKKSRVSTIQHRREIIIVQVVGRLRRKYKLLAKLIKSYRGTCNQLLQKGV